MMKPPSDTKHILAMEGYYGGSHRAFLDGWITRSRHQWDVVTLPPNKWKWRMRHGAFTFAERVNALAAEGKTWDVLFCSDMLNLAEFRGLVCQQVNRLPSVVYFHENQLTYPVRFEDERDYQYVVTNFTSALSADEVWFNSAFHRDDFYEALTPFFERMPDFPPRSQIASLPDKFCVQPPGIEPFGDRPSQRLPGPTRILWAARWEHDKNPEDFFQAIRHLVEKGLDFRLSVIGEQFRDAPAVFKQAQAAFADRIDRWGFLPSRQAYVQALTEADIVVSTACHEFFGIGMVEAISAGAYPLLPRRLAYPEILSSMETVEPDEFFYDGTVGQLAEKLALLIRRTENGDLWQGRSRRGQEAMARYHWDRRAADLDRGLEDLCSDLNS
ncbi:MAG TPA: DUF3524 domain-containing protein [Phycisphaerales bacterium]|nr:DUF3524 domain-containing protein [Phycisphaerales bacterium]